MEEETSFYRLQINVTMKETIESIVTELVPNTVFIGGEESNQEEIAAGIYESCMDVMLPNLLYIEAYGGSQEYEMASNEIPSYFYEDEDIKSDETMQQLEQTDETAAVSGNALASLNTQGGVSYTMEQLKDFSFVTENFYVVDSSTELLQEDLDLNTALEKDLSVDLSGGDYKILIYHTHGSETFADSRPGVLEDTIIGVGDTLAQILSEQYGVGVYHDRTVYDMVDGKLDRSYAYTQSSQGVDAILAAYPSIEVVIDLHRDGVAETTHLVTDINGKPTAKIMFLNGISRFKDSGSIDYLYNPYKQDNLAFSLQMYVEGKSMYPDLMRRIYIRGYRYNLDKMPRATLIEVGAQTNTLEEERNAMEPLAAILFKVLSGETEYDTMTE